MKLLTFQTKENPGLDRLGIMTPDGQSVLPLEQFGFCFASMNQLIDTLTEDQMAQLKEAASSSAKETLPYASILKRSPIPVPKQDIICLGINYAAHAEESARYKKEAFERNRQYAVYFSKRVNEAVADGASIQSHQDLLERLDYEAELAVIIGKDAEAITREHAFDYIFGYTILNDISAREIQTRHKQWYFGKSMDGFCPMGPWIVTKDEFSDPPILSISSRVNGELRQNSSTDLLLFSIAQVIEELSHGMKLKAGTIISMGTPAGVGMGFDPPKFLKPGDVVACEIQGIGTLTNPVV